MATGARVQSVNSISSGASNDLPSRKRVSPSECGVGVILLDSSLKLVSFNAEAIQILGFADAPETARNPDLRLARMIRATLLSRAALGRIVPREPVRSGRRDYSCRTFGWIAMGKACHSPAQRSCSNEALPDLSLCRKCLEGSTLRNGSKKC